MYIASRKEFSRVPTAISNRIRKNQACKILLPQITLHIITGINKSSWTAASGGRTQSRLSDMLSATSAITGSSIAHGPHHFAQNSTMTGFGFSKTTVLKSSGRISLTACPAGHIRSDGQKTTPTTPKPW